ncbi:MAG: DUF3575 domain-containing protein [Bacteroidetes bacterium]|nr:DUF3575 domain-containing protein [Bacteroidota bacterium]
MKTIIIVVITILSILQNVTAQKYRVEGGKNPTKSPKNKGRVYKNNIVKLNVSGLLFKSIGLQYEHKIKRKSSLAMGFIYRPMGSWVVAKIYDTASNLNISNETRFMYRTSEYRSLMLTPEYRYYLGKQAPKGLYLAPFIRLKADKTIFNYHYYDELTMEQKVGDAAINETMLGAGIMMGYQVVSRKKFTIDFWFLGPWGGYYNMSLKSKVNTAGISSLQQTFIGQDMGTVINDLTTVKWNEGGIDTKVKQANWGMRFFGINFGWSF